MGPVGCMLIVLSGKLPSRITYTHTAIPAALTSRAMEGSIHYTHDGSRGVGYEPQ